MKIIDLSLPVYDRAPAFPGDPECRVENLKTKESAGYDLNYLAFSAHQGTHVDVPGHFIAAGASLDALCPDKFMGWAAKADLSACENSRAIGAADLINSNLEINEGDICLIETGWDKYYGQAAYFSEYPGITVAAAEYLVSKRIKMLGIDMPNLNRGDEYIEIHKILLRNGILIVEGLADLKQVTAERFYFISLPLKIQGGEASPVRAVAIEY